MCRQCSNRGKSHLSQLRKTPNVLICSINLLMEEKTENTYFGGFVGMCMHALQSELPRGDRNQNQWTSWKIRTTRGPHFFYVSYKSKNAWTIQNAWTMPRGSRSLGISEAKLLSQLLLQVVFPIFCYSPVWGISGNFM